MLELSKKLAFIHTMPLTQSNGFETRRVQEKIMMPLVGQIFAIIKLLRRTKIENKKGGQEGESWLAGEVLRPERGCKTCRFISSHEA